METDKRLYLSVKCYWKVGRRYEPNLFSVPLYKKTQNIFSSLMSLLQYLLQVSKSFFLQLLLKPSGHVVAEQRNHWSMM